MVRVFYIVNQNGTHNTLKGLQSISCISVILLVGAKFFVSWSQLCPCLCALFSVNKSKWTDSWLAACNMALHRAEVHLNFCKRERGSWFSAMGTACLTTSHQWMMMKIVACGWKLWKKLVGGWVFATHSANLFVSFSEVDFWWCVQVMSGGVVLPLNLTQKLSQVQINKTKLNIASQHLLLSLSPPS